jgi:hypothetical protein
MFPVTYATAIVGLFILLFALWPEVRGHYTQTKRSGG